MSNCALAIRLDVMHLRKSASTKSNPTAVCREDRVEMKMQPILHRYIAVEGINIFYRETGPQEGQVILLLHGFPSSSRMFANLFPLLSTKYRLVAPDYPGFGHSDAPRPGDFSYTFDRLAECIDEFTKAIGIARYALYLQDYGGPIGLRLAAAHPERVACLVIQNAVAHTEGLSDAWTIRKEFWKNRPAHEGKIRATLLSQEVARSRHLTGVLQPERIDPDTWSDELAFLMRPGMADIQIELMFDYQSNVAAYPVWQAYLRKHQPPTLVVWGRHDPLFAVSGANAFKREVPNAEIHPLNAGHFALDEEAGTIATLIDRFIGRNAVAV